VEELLALMVGLAGAEDANAATEAAIGPGKGERSVEVVGKEDTGGDWSLGFWLDCSWSRVLTTAYCQHKGPSA
jgi:hypothetical protein